MPHHHEWYRERWNEILGEQPYRARWYNMQWRNIRKGELNQSLWPVLSLAIRSGLIGGTNRDHPAVRGLDLLCAFTSNIHIRFVQSIEVLSILNPHFDDLRLGEPLGEEGIGANRSPVKVRGLTRFQAKSLFDQSLKMVSVTLVSYDALEHDVATAFYSWMTNYQQQDLQSWVPGLRIGQSGSALLKLCSVVKVPDIAHHATAQVLANEESSTDESIKYERDQWLQFEVSLNRLVEQDGGASDLPEDMISTFKMFADRHRMVLSETQDIRRAVANQNRRDLEEMIEQAERETGLIETEDWD